MGSSATLDRSPRKNWVEKSGGLPPYVREVARSIAEKRGVPLSQAIAIAIGVMKRWASGKGEVDADTRAKAAKAVAQWEAAKVRNKSRQVATSHPADRAAVVELAKRVKTQAGADYYGLPIGSLIVKGAKKPKAGHGHKAPAAAKPAAAAATSAPKAAPKVATAPSKQHADYQRLKGMRDSAMKLGPQSKAAADYHSALAKYKTDYPVSTKPPATKPAAPKPAIPKPAAAGNDRLAALKAKADKLGPQSSAAAAYRAALDGKKGSGTPAPAAASTKPVRTPAGELSERHKADSTEGLSEAQKQALNVYTTERYRSINGGLRNPPPEAQDRKVIADLDAALAAKPLDQPTEVWRTVSGAAFGIGPSGDPATLKGKAFAEGGFMSTAAENQDFPPGGEPVVHMRLEVPPGVGAIYVAPLSEYPEEKELLLQRNLRYQVTGMKYVPAKGRWEATVQVLPAAA